MTPRTLAETLRNIGEKESALGSLMFKPRSPHHLRDGVAPIRPHWKFCGVYLLTKPTEPDWNVPFEESNADIWYIGMTSVNIFECMIRHFGHPRHGAPVVYEHRWTNNSAPPDINTYLARGDVVVYPIEVSSTSPQLTEKQRNLLPGLVEKQLIVAYADRYGMLPPLNLST